MGNKKSPAAPAQRLSRTTVHPKGAKGATGQDVRDSLLWERDRKNETIRPLSAVVLDIENYTTAERNRQAKRRILFEQRQTQLLANG
jgi:hypothetical protein